MKVEILNTHTKNNSGLWPLVKTAVVAMIMVPSVSGALAETAPTESVSLQLRAATESYVAGDYLSSADFFQQAAKSLENSIFEDDASYGWIRSLEADGQDGLAFQQWNIWLKENSDSPLVVEGALNKAWNLVRQGNPSGAENQVNLLLEAENWLAEDPRVHTLLAAITFHQENWQQTVVHLDLVRQSGHISAAALLLEGLCRQQMGQGFAATLAYQELIDEHPDSHLKGYAHMGKAHIFPGPENFRLAALEFARASLETTRQDHRAETRYLEASCLFLAGQQQQGLEAMHALAVQHEGTDLAARALFSMGEMRWHQGQYDLAIIRFNEVLSGYFAHELAGSALYRTGRCLDALGRTLEANSTYQAVAQGHPYAPEAPAAVYLAGVGLYEQGHYLDAAPYFQLVLDRYAGSGNVFVFESPEHQELIEASLCLLEFSYYQAGEMGKMAGAPHLALQKMPPSSSLWRAYTLLLDADALAAVDRYAESQETLATLLQEFPDHAVGIRANRLLAWTYARQGRQDLAIKTEGAMLARYNAQDDQDNLAGALLTMAHGHFNAKRYDEAATHYQEFIASYPGHPERLTALYQQGVCFVRCGRAGDAVDSWAVITSEAPQSEPARKAWLRSGDILFQAGHFEDARLQFTSLMENFPEPNILAAGTLRLGRCDFNEGKGLEALAMYRQVVADHPQSDEANEALEGITNILYTLGLNGENEYLTQLVDQYPDSPLAPEAGFQLAWRQYESGQYLEAAEAFQILSGKYPRYSAADRNFYYAADALLKAGKQVDAFASWETFLSYFPHSELAPAALLNLGNLRFNDGLYNPAIQDFQQVLARSKDPEIQAAALYNLALSQRILGQNDEAISSLNSYAAQAVTMDQRQATVARTLGEIHQELGHLREAARQYQQAILLGVSPEEEVELNFLAGLCLKEAGDMQGALGAYALSIASENKTSNFRLSALAQTADLHEQEGNFDGAMQAYRDLVQNATDPTLVGAAQDRLNQLETALGR